ncbi:MAG: tRNA lysidine(34) synthetase TilS [Clostridia bacterium]|nr:tRNA lysidine(34) synthetase TilS [Clostridia bacterium]
MLNKVLTAISRYSMLSAGDSVTVALSGGADSMALLHVLCANREKLGISVSAAHLNHMLRGEESDRDEAFVRDFCEQNGIPLAVERADVAAYAEKNGMGIEQAARAVRYDFLSRVSGGKTATAHTASDNAETVLINLTRGTALKGAVGIPPVRDRFIRPLIFCTRAEIEAYCKDNNLPFVTDSTNLSDDYTRNKLRHNVIPRLCELNPSFFAAVTRFTQAVGEDSEFLESVADAEFTRLYQNGILEIPKDMAPSVAKRLIARLLDIHSAGGDSLHICEIYEALGDVTCRSVSGGKTAQINDRKISVSGETREITFTVSAESIDLTNPEEAAKINKLLLKNAVDCDRIVGKVRLRTREEGDSIKLAGRGTKSLKKLYNELKIPQNMRKNLPVAADDDGVIWVCGAGVSERVRIAAESKKITVFTYQQCE